MSIFNIVIIVLFSISLCDVNVSLDLIDNKYIIVNIGEPAQQLKFYVDTSSPINIIFERGCRGCTTDKQNYYPNRSKSLKKSHIYYELDTIFGNFKGHFSNEQFIFSNLVNFNLDFLLVNETNSKVMECDGIVGLGIDNDEKFSEFSSMSLITRLKSENYISNKLVLFDNSKRQLRIGNAFPGSSEYAKMENSNNKTVFSLIQSEKEYPSAYANVKGLAYWTGNIEDSDDKILRDISLQIAFENSNEQKMNSLVIPSNKKEFLSDYLLKIILSKFTLNYDSKEEKESDQSTPEVKVQQVSDSNHLIVYYDNSTVQPNDYNIGLIINDNVIFYNTSTDKKCKLGSNIKNKFIFNVDITNDITDFVFLSLDYLNSGLIAFDYDENELKIFNCISCGIKTESKSYFWLFLSIIISSFVLSIFLFLAIVYYVKVKKIPHVKILKHYNLII